MVEHVLVPVDGSEMADRAFEFALNEFPDARFTVLYVVHPSDTSHEEGDILDSGKVLVGKPADILGSYGDEDRDIDKKIAVNGNEERSIVGFVEENDVDHVVMGSHGRTGAARVLLGSVAEKVARRAPVPVTVVR